MDENKIGSTSSLSNPVVLSKVGFSKSNSGSTKSSSTTSSRRRNAHMKLQLALLEKEQNAARRKAEEELQRFEEARKHKVAEAQRKIAEEEELQRFEEARKHKVAEAQRKIAEVEDDIRIRAAQIEAAMIDDTSSYCGDSIEGNSMSHPILSEKISLAEKQRSVDEYAATCAQHQVDQLKEYSHDPRDTKLPTPIKHEGMACNKSSVMHPHVNFSPAEPLQHSFCDVRYNELRPCNDLNISEEGAQVQEFDKAHLNMPRHYSNYNSGYKDPLRQRDFRTYREPLPLGNHLHNSPGFSCDRRSDPDQDKLFLPKPDIRKFEGDPMDYWAFWNRFRCHVADSLPNGKKMTYLLQYCNNYVRDQIQYLADNKQDRAYCYELAWEELKRRYGQPHIIAQACEERLRALPSFTEIDPDRLGKMSVLMKRCCSSLDGVTGLSTLDTVSFTTVLVNKLPPSLREEWVRTAVRISDSTSKVATFQDLASFVVEQARVANSVYGLKMFSQKCNSVYNRKPKATAFTTQTNQAGVTQRVKETDNCICCFRAGGHKLYHCGKFSGMSYEEKWKIIRKNFLCKLCLLPGHMANRCDSGLECKKRFCNSKFHHTLLHPPTPINSHHQFRTQEYCKREPVHDHADANVYATHTNEVEGRGAYLDIVPVKVCCGNETVETYALLDTASDHTFCEKGLVDLLKVNQFDSKKCLAMQTMTSTQHLEASTISLNVSSLEGDNYLNLGEVLVVDKIPVKPCVLPSENKIQQVKHLRGVNLRKIKNGSVSLLIGNNYAAAHRCLECRFSPNPSDTPDAVLTPLGWLLRGTHFKETPQKQFGSNFLVRGMKWSNDTEDIQNLVITDEGETFSPSGDPDLYDKEGLMKLLQSHKEMLEFGFKYSREDPVAYDTMCRQLKRVGGQYQLPLLWRNDAVLLPESREMALRRLDGLKRRLQRDDGLKEKYAEQMQTTFEKGYAEEVPEDEIVTSNPEWYLPHHPVINPKKPDKVRPVYDCAAMSRGYSLNDFLMKGPDLMNSLVGVLLRFRKGRIAITSDVEAMFYQVKARPRDRDAMRFLWWPKGDLSRDPKVCRMTVHIFGAKSSPSCASFCLRETAREFGKYFDPHVAETVLKHFYADDCLVTVESDEAGINLINDLRRLLAMGGFKLTKWLSTSQVVTKGIPEEDKSKAIRAPLPSEGPRDRVLGINWDVKNDEFQFLIDLPDKRLTKRHMLSITNSIYDPLGFVAPVVLEARLIFTDLCQKKLGWDDPADAAIQKRWNAWKSSLSSLKNVKVPRCYKFKMNIQNPNVQLHFFSDASKSARGCACYLRSVLPDSTAVCSLVIGKSLSPGSGRLTIPRLELEAALDAVNLSRTVKQELELPDCPCIFWSDSMIVIQSLQAESKKFPMFSRNRLQKILTHTKVYDWCHVPTKLNPADQASRGVTADAFIKSGMWLHGPEFLKRPPEEWPQSEITKPQTEKIYDVYKPVSMTESQSSVQTFVTSTSEGIGTEALISYFSSFFRLKLATAWLLRFKTYLKSKLESNSMIFKKGPITVEELNIAEDELVKFEQRQSFPLWFKCLTEGKKLQCIKEKQIEKLSPALIKDVLRVGGRIDKAALGFEARHPAILAPYRHLTSLIIDDYHSEKAKHFGEGHTLNLVAQKYWIISAKVAVKKVLQNCLLCNRRKSKPGQQIMGELPEARLRIGEPPFSSTGVDYFGPISVRVGRSDVKRYGCLFTCMITRAIHLEVAPDLTTSSFINALRRFVARRGPVKRLFSDNGSNFVGCERTLKKALSDWNQEHINIHLRQKEIEWSFNPPGASHMSGVWERMIRTVRQILMNILPKQALTDDVLHTLLLEVEDIVNSRPLTDVNPEVDGNLPLTPNHLLRLNSSLNMSPLLTNEKDAYDVDRYRRVQLLADKFWERWVLEYPRTLMPRSKWLHRRQNLKIGDIVLLKDDSTPRQQWPLGRIVTTFPDRKGDVRTVVVRTANGILKRPITKLCVIVPDGDRGRAAEENLESTDELGSYKNCATE